MCQHNVPCSQRAIKLMRLSEIKEPLANNVSRNVRFILPTGSKISPHAHITEVARAEKEYIDWGGTHRTDTVCRLQTWFQDDPEHRLTARTLAAILEKSALFLTTNILKLRSSMGSIYFPFPNRENRNNERRINCATRNQRYRLSGRRSMPSV